VTNTGQPAFREIRYDVAGGTATMTLHRPDRLNAFTRTMAGELVAAFDLADADDAVRVVLLTGAGRG
jgi:enoyl-CoA hydratase/carnithine racemase